MNMNMVSNQFNLPLFLVSRNHIKPEHLDKVRNYIGKKRTFYTRHCAKDNDSDTATKKKSKHISFDLKHQPPCTIHYQRTQDNKDSWRLPPNLYNVQNIPFNDRKGSTGAYWKKSSTHKPLRHTPNLPQLKPHSKFYNLERRSERCLKIKDIFLPNARARRATTRCMISSLAGCYHDPNEPGPNRYFPQNFMIANNVSPVIKTRPPEPYIFLPHTSVPETSNSIQSKRKAFSPGPGYYENRFSVGGYNLNRLVYMPGLDLLIDHEKRKKFRHLPYIKIKARKYFSPDWQHVIGHGYRRLFKHSRSWKSLKDLFKVRKELKDSGKDQKEIKETFKQERKLYAEQRYIQMINNPNRRPISLREKGSYTKKPPKERYTYVQKKDAIMRRKVKRSNKRIAFNSCQERFKNTEKPAPLTAEQLRKIKRSLPFELRKRNYPIMTKQPDEIFSKLTLTPKRYQAPENLEVHKHFFRFSPIPTGKVLVSAEETHISSAAEFYDNKLDPTSFFRNDI